MLGHLTLLGLSHPVMPWCTDGPSEAEMGGTLEVTMSDWADRCHAQGGTVILPHLPDPNGEPATLIATGRADAVEFLWHGAKTPWFRSMYTHLEYYAYLNAGLHPPLGGGPHNIAGPQPPRVPPPYASVP